MGDDQPTNPFTQTEPTHKLSEPAHLRMYPTQPATTYII